MIRNAVIHVTNEQPLLADLYAVPGAGDQGLLCTNVRMLDGKRPVFIDDIAATFFFPYRVIRFVEIPPRAMERHAAETGGDSGPIGRPAGNPTDADARLPVVVGGTDDGSGTADDPELDLDLDIDEGFLQRIREI